MNQAAQNNSRPTLAKTPTGIDGLDEIAGGGLPQGRPTLICGGAGCGKTLFAMEFLVRGATEFNEPGVFIAFEETAEELTENVRSLGFDLNELVNENKLEVDYVRVEPSEIEESGEYDLEGLFVRLGFAIDSIGAKRIVLDTIETLFSGLTNQRILRSELRLYVAGQSAKSIAAFTNLRKICEEYMPGRYSIEVIDLIQNPKLAKGDQIVAIPTVIRKLPEPLCRLVGDLHNTEQALVGLQLRSKKP